VSFVAIAMFTTLYSTLYLMRMGMAVDASCSSLNLTRRIGVPPLNLKPNMPKVIKAIAKTANAGKNVYMIPAIILMNKEFSTLESLCSTSLMDAGLASGSSLLRLLFRYSEKTLQESLPDIEATDLAAAARANNSSNNSKSTTISRSITSEAPAVSAEPSNPQPQLNSRVDSGPGPDAEGGIHANQDSADNAAELINSDIIMAHDAPDTCGNDDSNGVHMPVSSVVKVEEVRKTAMSLQEDVGFDRNVKVFKPPSDAAGPVSS
jgi:hypothetical protein